MIIYQKIVIYMPLTRKKIEDAIKIDNEYKKSLEEERLYNIHLEKIKKLHERTTKN